MAKHYEIPYVPRVWAKGFHASMARFMSMILHRRAGKTTAILNHHVRAALLDEWEGARLKAVAPGLSARELGELVRPPGGRHYGHVMPTRVQAKAVAWDKLKYYASPVKGGKPNESDLLYRFPNGNKVQLFGADDPDSLRGLAFSGLSFDEYSQQPQNIFSEVLSKALADHLGYAIFAGTIKGKDHLYRNYAAAKGNPGWFSLWQDVDESLKSETGVTIKVLRQAMDDDLGMVRDGLMSREEYDQEWFLSLEAAIKGAYYMEQMSECRKAGRITSVPYDPAFPVYTAWDLGHSDDTAIWFYQNIGRQVRVLDSWAESGGTLEKFEGGEMRPGSIVRAVMSRPYKYGRHWLPHDARAKTLGSDGKSIVEKLVKWLGMGTISIVPEIGVEDGIQAARSVLGRTWFDEVKCDEGINALLHYRKKYDNRAEAYQVKPVHNWASHRSDAFRMLAVAEREIVAPEPPVDKRVEAERAVFRMIKENAEVTLDEVWARNEERLEERVGRI